MNHLNQVLVAGTIVQKTELKKLPSGTNFCQFTARCEMQEESFSGKTKRTVNEIEMFAYDNLALRVSTMKVGEDIRVIGSLKQVKWTDSTRKERSRLVILADHINSVFE